MYFMTQGQRVLILEKTKKLKGVSRHSQASMFMFADVAALQAEEPGEGSPMTAKEALGPIRPISQKSPFKNALKRKPLGDITNPPAATSSFDGPPFKKHLVAHERTLPDLGLGVWDQKELLDNRAARIRQLTQTAANGFQKLAPPQRLSYFRRHETEDVLKAIYEHEAENAYRPTRLAVSPWSQSMQHGGPVLGLFARELENAAAETGMQVARLPATIPAGIVEVLHGHARVAPLAGA